MLVYIFASAVFIPLIVFFAAEIYNLDRKEDRVEWWTAVYLLFVFVLFLILFGLSILYPSLNNKP